MLSARIQRLKQRLTPVLGPIIQRFSRNSYRWSESGTQPLGPLPGLPSGAYVLPRESILFTRISLGDVPPRQRSEALKLELEQRAPFDDPAGWVWWQGGQACIWYWPQELETRIEAESEAGVGRLEFIPETALWPEVGQGNYRWVDEGAHGLVLVQYQHPQQGLYEKRYSGRVSREEIAAWLQRHGAGSLSADSLVATSSPGWASPVGAALESRSSSLETRVFPLAALLLGFFIVAYGVAITRAVFEADEAKARAQRMEQSVSDVVEMRQRASRLHSKNALLADYTSPSQVEVAAQLAEVLDMQGGRLVRWAYRDGRLEVSWEPDGAMPDSTKLITSLEEIPRFSNVQAQSRGGTLIEMSMLIAASKDSSGEAPDD